MPDTGNIIVARREGVKYLVGLRLASVGIHTFREAALRVGCHWVTLSKVLNGRQQTAWVQSRLAALCGCGARDLFGDLTHPSLAGRGEDPRLAERDRIRALLRGTGVATRRLAEAAGFAPGTVRRLIRGDLRSPFAQMHVLRAFRRMTGSPITMVQFWGRLTAREVA